MWYRAPCKVAAESLGSRLKGRVLDRNILEADGLLATFEIACSEFEREVVVRDVLLRPAAGTRARDAAATPTARLMLVRTPPAYALYDDLHDLHAAADNDGGGGGAGPVPTTSGADIALDGALLPGVVELLGKLGAASAASLDEGLLSFCLHRSRLYGEPL